MTTLVGGEGATESAKIRSTFKSLYERGKWEMGASRGASLNNYVNTGNTPFEFYLFPSQWQVILSKYALVSQVVFWREISWKCLILVSHVALLDSCIY